MNHRRLNKAGQVIRSHYLDLNPDSEKWMCGDKRRFRTEKSALNQIKQLKKTGRIITETFKPYHCPWCGKWHLGHDRKGRYR